MSVPIIRHKTAPNPFGCRWCGDTQHQHGLQWVASRGMHRWERPTNQQIKARMTARRAARTAKGA